MLAAGALFHAMKRILAEWSPTRRPSACSCVAGEEYHHRRRRQRHVFAGEFRNTASADAECGDIVAMLVQRIEEPAAGIESQAAGMISLRRDIGGSLRHAVGADGKSRNGVLGAVGEIKVLSGLVDQQFRSTVLLPS